jgi:16S rRNA processing protein RimM
VRDFVDIGRVSRPRGLRGEVWVTPWSDDPERLLGISRFRLLLPAGPRELRLAGGQWLNGRLALLFEGVADRDAAQALCGGELQIRAEDLPPLAEDEVFLADLVGLEARLADGRVVGRVRHVLEMPAGPLLEIAGGGREALVPFARRFVPRLELAEGWLELSVPEGLLPEGMVDE